MIRQNVDYQRGKLLKILFCDWPRLHFNKFPCVITLSQRTFQYRDKSTIGMKFGQNLGTALIVGLVYLRTPWNPNDMPYDQVDAFNINGAIFRKKFFYFS